MGYSNLKNMSKRTRYFFSHLMASSFLGIVLSFIVFYLWYPGPIAVAEGVTRIFCIILIIDIIVGPLLSLIIYKEGKGNLKIDLLLIILIQLAAMSYGVYSIMQSRPVWISQNGAIFQLVRANAILPQDQVKALIKFRQNGWWEPVWVAVNQADPKYELYSEPTLVPNLYIELRYAIPRIRKYAQSIDRLALFNTQHRINKELTKYPQAVSWMPLRTTGLDLVVLFDSEHKIIGVVNLRPWSQ